MANADPERLQSAIIPDCGEVGGESTTINPLIEEVKEPATSETKAKKPVSKKDLVIRMLHMLVDEFNCNHQADLQDETGRRSQDAQ